MTTPDPETNKPTEDQTATNNAPELRTFLFADIRGYTRFTQERGDLTAARLVEKFVALMRTGTHARGGEVIELRGDEVLAVFSSARQALRSALDLQARFARELESDPSLPLPVGMGIDAGEAVPLESGYRGEALNLAARLCNLAGPGEILVSEGVVYLARRVQGIAYTDRGPQRLKGFSDPVRVIQVQVSDGAQRPSAAYRADSLLGRAEMSMPIGGFLGALPAGVMVGRDREWEQIMAGLETVTQGSGRLLLLSGEPGIGKTRLAQEVTLKARHWGFLIVTGRCYEAERSVPYFPFVEALSTLYDAASFSMRTDIGQRWPQLHRLLPERVAAPDLTHAELEQEDQHHLFRAVTGWVQAVAELVPVALLLDDLHWADDASLKLLQYVARYTRGARVLILGTYRDVEIHRRHPLDTALLDLGREHIVTEVEVRRLDLPATSALIGEILGDLHQPDDLAEIVYRRTDGNAFFIEEMVRAMVERGDLYRVDGRWERRTINDMEVPKSIRSVIGQRLSQLDEGSQEILREASVLGQEFAFDDLLALGNLTLGTGPGANIESQPGRMEDDIEAALEQAVAAGLARETDHETYVFNHALTQQTLYAELSNRRRKRLHLAAGQALARIPERERTRRAGELSWHFLEGDDPEQALQYALLAGNHAAEVFANGEAEVQYRSALELARELEDRPREINALEKLAGTLTIVAQYDRALELLEQAAQLQRTAGNREGEACVVAQLGHVHFLRNTSKHGLLRLEPFVESYEAVSPEASFGLAALWGALGRLYSDLGRSEDQLRAAERAIELAGIVEAASSDHRRGEAATLRLGAEVTRSDALWDLGKDQIAIQAIEELIPRAEEMGDLNNLARALSNAATYYARRGEFEKDRQYHERMLEISERRGDRGMIVLAAMALSTNAFVTGQWAEARSYLGRAEAIVRTLGDTRLALWPLSSRAWLALREGDLETADRAAREVQIVINQADSIWHRMAERLLAERDLRLGRPAAGLARLESLLEQTASRRHSDCYWMLAWLHTQMGNADQAQDLAARAVQWAQARRHQPDLVDALVIQGVAQTRQNSWEEAETIFRASLETARALPYPYGEARTLYEYGMMHAQRGELNRAQRRLKRAAEIFDKLGASQDSTWSKDALSSLTHHAQ